MIWTIPNCLTIFRFLLVPLFLVLILENTYTARLLSLLVFVIAAITDFLDGKIARTFNQRSEFGKFADPLADKCLVAAALIAFAFIPETLIPLWMVILILAREVIITILRIAAINNKKSMRTSMLGKAKTALQMASITLILILLIGRAYFTNYSKLTSKMNPAQFWTVCTGSATWGSILGYTPLALIIATLTITVASGAHYLFVNRELLFTKKN